MGKTCVTCKESKPRGEFYKSKTNADGLRTECRDCWRERSQAYRKANRDKVLAKMREYGAKNAEWLNPRARQYHRDNRERILEYQAQYRKKNWPRKLAQNREREISKIQRTPSWADRAAVRFFYECRPEGCHVDHIIPLQGKTISGLHIETNLQWMPASKNISKGNKF